MTFVEDSVKDYLINRLFVSQIHKKIIDGLEPPHTGEGTIRQGSIGKKM